MRILFVCKASVNKKANPFIGILMSQLSLLGHECDNGLDKFWNSYSQYDLLFFEWPEVLTKDFSDVSYNRIKTHISAIKKAGVKMIMTCHNLESHDKNPFYSRIYSLLYGEVDAIHHLGEYSYQLFNEKYPNKLNFVSPHPVFFDCKKIGPSKSDSKKALGLRNNDFVIMSFGAFRNNDEREIVWYLKKHFKNVVFLMPRFVEVNFKSKNIVKTACLLLKYLYVKVRGIKMRLLYIKNEELPTFFNASDIVLIQRCSILNSGNLPLGFSAGKVVVGPNVGNVGSILKQTGNPVFNPEDKKTIITAVSTAIEESYNDNNLGQQNYIVACKDWTPETTVKIINENIHKLFANCTSI